LYVSGLEIIVLIQAKMLASEIKNTLEFKYITYKKIQNMTEAWRRNTKCTTHLEQKK